MELLAENRKIFGSIAEERRRKAHSTGVSYESCETAFRETIRRHGRHETLISDALDFAKSLDFQSSSLGKSYLSHPLRVASFLLEWEPRIEVEYIAVALLHNVLETAQMDGRVLQERFGATVADGIRLLTVDRTVPFEQIEEAYYARLFAAGQSLALVKLFDKMDNLFVLCLNPDADVRARYLEEIERRLVPFARKCGNHLADYLEGLVADARQTGYLSIKEIL